LSLVAVAVVVLVTVEVVLALVAVFVAQLTQQVVAVLSNHRLQ
jgi:hypothetical protein